MSSPTPCCASPTCASSRSPKYQPLARKACLTAVTGKQSPCFGYYSQRRDLLMLHRAPKPLLLKLACALKAGEEAIQLNRVLRVGEDWAAEKRKRWNRRRGGGIGQSALKFGISVGEEGEGVEQHVEESGGAIVGDGGEKIEDLADEGGVSVVFPSSTNQKETVSLPLRERTSAPPSREPDTSQQPTPSAQQTPKTTNEIEKDHHQLSTSSSVSSSTKIPRHPPPSS